MKASQLLHFVEPYKHLWGQYFTFSVAPLSIVPALSWEVLGDVDRSLDALRGTRQQALEAGHLGLLPLLDTQRCELLARNGRDATEALAEVRRGAEQVGAPALVVRAERAIAQAPLAS